MKGAGVAGERRQPDSETVWKALTFIRRLLQFPHPARDLL